VDARVEVRTLLAESLRTLAIPTLIVTHDVHDVLALASRVAVLEAGRIVACEKPDRLKTAPPTPFAARLLGSEGHR
jgi:ABC-type sulfate/molybdate transport systems ATPase subunit